MKRTIVIASTAAILGAGLAIGMQPPAGQPPATTPPASKPPAAQPPATNPGQPKEEKKPEIKLKVGDMAPPLKIDEWLKGDSVTALEKGKIYVLVFWSTTDKQSIDEVPHLTDLQKRYKDIVIVGVASPGHGEATGDLTIDRVEKFVMDMGTKIGYRIGFDADGDTFKPYMDGAGRNKLPTAFVVDNSTKLAWIGHPKDLDKELDRMMAVTPAPKPKDKD